MSYCRGYRTFFEKLILSSASKIEVFQMIEQLLLFKLTETSKPVPRIVFNKLIFLSPLVIVYIRRWSLDTSNFFYFGIGLICISFNDASRLVMVLTSRLIFMILYIVYELIFKIYLFVLCIFPLLPFLLANTLLFLI